MSAQKLTIDSDSAIWVSFNETSGNKTQMMTIALRDHKKDKNDLGQYYIQNVTVKYSDNLFPGSNDTSVKMIRSVHIEQIWLWDGKTHPTKNLNLGHFELSYPGIPWDSRKSQIDRKKIRLNP